MAESSCVYVVTFVPEGCTSLGLSDIVTSACESPCEDRVVSDGPCAGAMLAAVSDQCMVYPPEDEANREKVKGARSKGGSTSQKPIKSSEITGHYPQKK